MTANEKRPIQIHTDFGVFDSVEDYQTVVESMEWWDEVAAERQRQIDMGYDAAHDDSHPLQHLLVWAQNYARRGEPIKSAALIQAAIEKTIRDKNAETR